jgi:hypothetical protein
MKQSDEAQFRAFWDWLDKGLAEGRDDDLIFALSRLHERFGIIELQDALDKLIYYAPSSFEQRKRQLLADEAARRRRNPKGAGAKPAEH